MLTEGPNNQLSNIPNLDIKNSMDGIFVVFLQVLKRI